MTTTTKTNLMVPNKLNAFNRVKLIAMADAGVRHSAIARDLGITQQSVLYHVNRQKQLVDKYTDKTATVSHKEARSKLEKTTIESLSLLSKAGSTLVTNGYLVGSTYYATLQEVKDVAVIGDSVKTITVTATQTVGLVEQKEG